MPKKSANKWQFGDFQTPDDLAQEVVNILKHSHGISPNIIIEPSCGKGAFLRSALKAFNQSSILCADINQDYVEYARASISECSNAINATLQWQDFFNTDWKSIVDKQDGYVLIIGNPPWVTSSELSTLNSKNIPVKSNFQNRRGIESITGAGNFDISEWMLLEYVKWLSKRPGTIAVLCKYSVARKVLRQLDKQSMQQFSSHIYLIDAKAHFNASVEACLFILHSDATNHDCKVYSQLVSSKPAYTIGKRDGLILSNVNAYEKWKHLLGKELRYVWRSGVKHDCSKVMEITRIKGATMNTFMNGLGEVYSLEEDYLYPLLKSSDVGNGRVTSYRKLALITQKSVGQDTSIIRERAPKTWDYLKDYESYLNRRKSSIYKDKPPYAIFGIGDYTFKPWKVAISGLYKQLSFQLIGPLDGKTAVFDDTVNFLFFDTQVEAEFIFKLVASVPSLEVLNAMIFWDEKRPVTISVLRRLSLKSVAKELGILDQYLSFATAIQASATGQFELGLAEKQSFYNV